MAGTPMERGGRNGWTRRSVVAGPAVLPLVGSALAACSPPGSSAPAAGATPATRGPLTIEVLTRAGVGKPTGHSQGRPTRRHRPGSVGGRGSIAQIMHLP